MGGYGDVLIVQQTVAGLEGHKSKHDALIERETLDGLPDQRAYKGVIEALRVRLRSRVLRQQRTAPVAYS